MSEAPADKPWSYNYVPAGQSSLPGVPAPRPHWKDPAIIAAAADRVVALMVSTGSLKSEETPGLAEAIAKYGQRMSDGYILASDLDRYAGCNCNLAMAQDLDCLGSFWDDELKKAEQAWRFNNNIEPPFAVPHRVRLKSGETGLADAIDRDGTAKYHVAIDGDEAAITNHRRRIVNFEDCEPINSWPQDHPGRNCAKCGVLRYPIWIDPVNPPPGTCVEGRDKPAECRRVMNDLLLVQFVQKAFPQPHTAELMQRCGIGVEDVLAEVEFNKAVDAADADLMTKHIMIGDGSENDCSVADWLAAGGDPAPRLLALLKSIGYSLDLSLNGKRNMGEIMDAAADLQERAAAVLESAIAGDYEPGEEGE